MISDDLLEPILLGKEAVPFFQPLPLQSGRKTTDVAVLVLFLASLCAAAGILVSSFFVPTETASGFIGTGLSKIVRDRYLILLTSAICVLIGFLWMELLRRFPRWIILGTILISFIMVFMVGVHFMTLSMYVLGSLWLAGSLIIPSVAYAGRRRLDFTAILIGEACRGIRANLFLLYVIAPILLAAWLLFAWFIGGAAVSLYNSPDVMRYSLLFLLFEFIWVTALMLAVFQYTVAGTLASWYFAERDMTRNLLAVTSFNRLIAPPPPPPPPGAAAAAAGNGDRRNLNTAIDDDADSDDEATAAGYRNRLSLLSLRLALTRSLGSLALGSLVVALVASFNMLVKYLESRNKASPTTSSGIGSRLVAVLWQTLAAASEMLEFSVRFMNRFAVIYMSMYGLGFKDAAITVSKLISRAGMTTAVSFAVSDLVLVCGEILGVALSVQLYISLSRQLMGSVAIFPLLVCGVLAFTVFRTLSHTLRVGIDTMLVCYMEDLMRNMDAMESGERAEYSKEFSTTMHYAVQRLKMELPSDL